MIVTAFILLTLGLIWMISVCIDIMLRMDDISGLVILVMGTVPFGAGCFVWCQLFHKLFLE